MIKYKHFLPLVFLIHFFACSQKEKVKESGQQYFELETLDSLDLDVLGAPILASINENGDIAFYDFPSKEILITDKDGEIQHRFTKQEDTPDTYGFMMELPILWGRDRTIVIGLNGIFIYNLDGTMIKKIDHVENMGGGGFMAFSGKTAKIITLKGKDYLLMKSLRSRDTFNGEQKFYDTYKALDLVGLETGEMKDFGPFEEGSKFLDGKGYIESDYAPAYAESEGRLYLAHGADPKVYIYDFSAEDAKLDSTLQLSIPGFQVLEGVDRKEFSEDIVTINGGTPAIRNIAVVKGKILIQFYPGIDPEKMEEAEALWLAGKEDESEALYEKIENEVKSGLLIYDEQTLELLGELIFPENINKDGFASDGEFIYMEKTKSEEMEEDFLRVYKMKLTAK